MSPFCVKSESLSEEVAEMFPKVHIWNWPKVKMWDVSKCMPECVATC